MKVPGEIDLIIEKINKRRNEEETQEFLELCKALSHFKQIINQLPPGFASLSEDENIEQPLDADELYLLNHQEEAAREKLYNDCLELLNMLVAEKHPDLDEIRQLKNTVEFAASVFKPEELSKEKIKQYKVVNEEINTRLSASLASKKTNELDWEIKKRNIWGGIMVGLGIVIAVVGFACLMAAVAGSFGAASGLVFVYGFMISMLVPGVIAGLGGGMIKKAGQNAYDAINDETKPKNRESDKMKKRIDIQVGFYKNIEDVSNKKKSEKSNKEQESLLRHKK